MNDTKVVRYDPDSSAYGYFLGMRKAEYGDYVTHADYSALEEELAALRVRVGETK
jgi:hypothetical protein